MQSAEAMNNKLKVIIADKEATLEARLTHYLCR